MEGTRLRILQLLQKDHRNTVEGLAKAIGLAQATIRRHLDILQRDRLVVFEEVRKRTGRPEYSFYLTESGHEALPKDYDHLLGMVIGELSALSSDHTSSRTGQQILELIFKRLAEKVADGYRDQTEGQDLSSRLDTLGSWLKQAHFYPEIESKNGRVNIRLLNCPFRSVALKNMSVCSFDFNLISSMLNVDIELQERIQDGDPCCTYTALIGAGVQASEA